LPDAHARAASGASVAAARARPGVPKELLAHRDVTTTARYARVSESVVRAEAERVFGAKWQQKWPHSNEISQDLVREA
jgi:hypothetical protein